MKKVNSILICFILSTNILFSQSFEKLSRNADSLYSAEQYKKAILIYTKMLVLQPKSVETYINRGYSYYYSKNYKQAIKDADQGLALKPSIYYEDKLIRLKGYSFFYWEKYDEAIRFLSEDLAVNLQEYYSYLLRGKAYYLTENYDKAISDLRQGLQDRDIDPHNKLFALETIGLCYIDQDSISKTWVVIKELNKIDSSCAEVSLLKGQIYYAQKEYEKAHLLFEKAFARDTTYFGLINWMGYCDYNLKKYDAAIKNFKIYEKKSPRNSEANNMISCTLFLQKKYSEALPYADKAILYDKLNAEAFDTRGCVFYKMSSYTKAIVDFNKSLQLDPTLLNSYYFRGASFLKINKNKEACVDFQKLSLDKDYKVKEGEIVLDDLINKNCR